MAVFTGKGFLFCMNREMDFEVPYLAETFATIIAYVFVYSIDCVCFLVAEKILTLLEAFATVVTHPWHQLIQDIFFRATTVNMSM